MSESKKYAVIKTGGHQYKVAEGDVVQIEKVAGEAGETVTFDTVLAVSKDSGLAVGAPTVDGATVTGTVVEQFKDAKVIAYKKKRRKGFHWKKGHRQEKTAVRIEAV